MLDDYKQLKADIDAHNARRATLPRDVGSVAAYNAEKAELDTRRDLLEAELQARGVRLVPRRAEETLEQIDAGR